MTVADGTSKNSSDNERGQFEDADEDDGHCLPADSDNTENGSTRISAEDSIAKNRLQFDDADEEDGECLKGDSNLTGETPNRMKSVLGRLGKKRGMPGFEEEKDGPAPIQTSQAIDSRKPLAQSSMKKGRTLDNHESGGKKMRIEESSSDAAKSSTEQQHQQQQQQTSKSQPSKASEPASIPPNSTVTTTSGGPQAIFVEQTPETKYVDCAKLPDPPKQESSDNFAQKLYNMFEQIEFDGKAHIAGFLHHGRAFAIHDEKTFVETTLAEFGFRQKRLDTFVLELLDHGFREMKNGCFYHELFLRSRPGLCVNLRCNPSQTQTKKDHPEPNFSDYPEMPPMPFRQRQTHKKPRGRMPMMHDFPPGMNPFMPMLFPDRDSKTLYADFAAWPDPPRQVSGSGDEFFPLQLHSLLQLMQLENSRQIASFRPHGRAFIVLDEIRFEKVVLPRFFPYLQFNDFQQLLVDYGFELVPDGKDVGAYYHELFLRGRPGLSINMRRGVGKQPINRECQPDLYHYPALPDFGIPPSAPAIRSSTMANAPPQSLPQIHQVPFPTYHYPYSPFGHLPPFPMQSVALAPPVKETISTTLDDPSMAQPVSVSKQITSKKTVLQTDAKAQATASEELNSGSETEDEMHQTSGSKAKANGEKWGTGSDTDDDGAVAI